MRKFVISGLGLALLALVASGCSKPPETEIAAVNTSLQSATTAGAGEYAPESLAAAESAKRDLDAELKVQQEKFALFRSYDKSKQLAATAKSAADKAAADAAAGKTRAKEEATQLAGEAKTAIEEVKAMIEKAPRGKGSQADIAAMKSDLAGIEASLSEIDSAMAEERYLQAKAKAEAAKQNVEQIRNEILQAMEATKAAHAKH
jgi:hypothetical protein